MSYVEFEVLGNPAAQGSKRHLGNGVMVESSKKVKPWRDSVAAAAREQAEGQDEPMDGPLLLRVEFRFQMPASRRKALRAAGVGPKTTAPDLDKLVRAVGDAVQVGGLIRDDARFQQIDASKIEVTGWTGARIRIETL